MKYQILFPWPRWAAWTIAAAVSAVAIRGDVRAQQNEPPRFRTSVELTSIDVAVVDGQGKPVANLMPADFTVRVDNKPRAVVSAEWVPLAARSGPAKAPARVPEGYSSNENSTGGRLIAIVVDEPHIRPGGAGAVLAAATAFIDRLSPSDRIAAVSLAIGGPATPFTSDRQRVKDAIGRMSGQRETIKISNLTITPAEALEMADGNRLTSETVYQRECAGLRNGTAAMNQCRQEVDAEAALLSDQLRRSSGTTERALRDVLEALRPLDGPKTLILMSEGFPVADGGQAMELGELAAATRTSIYALKLDRQLFEIANARAPVNDVVSNLRADGLEMLAGAARGALFNVNGTGSQLFSHIESELSGYYLLGVESDAADRDRKPHAIKIDVSRRGAMVRTRRQLLNVSADINKPKNAREAVSAALTAPLLSSGLPLRIATFSLRGPEAGKVQLLIRAEVGSDYIGPRPGVIGYVIMDRDGKNVEQRTVNAVLTPVMNGVPGPLQYAGGASLDPGEYTIKLAVAEGDRLGSVEHPIHASLGQADGKLVLSDLMVGGPIDTGDLVRPTVGYTISYGTVHGYVEAYGQGLERVSATYEVAATADGPSLLSTNVAQRTAGGDRALFSQIVPVGKLPPGEYLLRARLQSGGTPLKTLTRRFEIAPPAVLMTSAAVAGGPAPAASVDLFLPVDEGMLSRPFSRELALAAPTLEVFQKRVPAGTKTAFDQGVAALQQANYAGAIAQFKTAIRPDGDSTAALAYLGAALAAGGAAAEAASVWQTALVDGSDMPQIYEWLADGLIRTKDFTAARSILEEAIGRWPADTRFQRMLAFSYATLGRGREAIRALDRYIADGHSEPDLLYLAVEWIFQAHNNRTVVVNPTADLTLARGYADAYTKANGPKLALVKQWMEFLENERR